MIETSIEKISRSPYHKSRECSDEEGYPPPPLSQLIIVEISNNEDEDNIGHHKTDLRR